MPYYKKLTDFTPYAQELDVRLLSYQLDTSNFFLFSDTTEYASLGRLPNKAIITDCYLWVITVPPNPTRINIFNTYDDSTTEDSFYQGTPTAEGRIDGIFSGLFIAPDQLVRVYMSHLNLSTYTFGDFEIRIEYVEDDPIDDN